MFAEGTDYTARPINFTLTWRFIDFNIHVPIIDDHVYELHENFFVNITTTDNNVVIERNSAAINIEDDEGKKDEVLLVKAFIVSQWEESLLELTDLPVI